MEKVKKDEKRKEERRKDERRKVYKKSNKNFTIKYSVFSSPCPICSIYLVWFR